MFFLGGGGIIFITCILSWLRTICISNRLPLTAFIIAYNAFLTLNNEQNRTVCVCVCGPLLLFASFVTRRCLYASTAAGSTASRGR